MNMRLDYSYQARLGVPGTLYDISPHAIDSRLNDESTIDAMQFGIGVFQGDSPGKTVRKPIAGDALATFEGISMGSQTTSMDMQGERYIRPQQTIGVLRWGRAWVRIVPGRIIQYGDPLFLITSGINAGLFTNEATNNLAINAMFIGELGTSDVAPVEVYNQSNQGGRA